MTFGEIISTALINTLLGMGTVFAMLILISFVIYLFQYIPKESAKERKERLAREKEEKRLGEKAAEGIGRMEQDQLEQGELVAVIMAAIMEAQKHEAGQAAGALTADGQAMDDGQPWPYVVRSIRRRR